MNEDTLTEYRKQIDDIDTKIVELISERMKVVEAVGVYKKERNIPPLAEERWQQVLDSKMTLAEQLGIKPEYIKEIFEMIHKYALELEHEV